MIKFVQNVIRWASVIHEIWHWIAAKLLGLEVDFYPNHVCVEVSDRPWKNIAVALAPAIATGLILIGVIFAIRSGLSSGWLWPAFFLWASSIRDVLDVIKYFRTGEWDG